MTILVTGAAGFIGFHLARRLLVKGYHVIGLDNLNDYYDVCLKKDRLRILQGYGGFEFFQYDLTERDQINQLFLEKKISVVIHLAAQAGVRYSLKDPHSYVHSNLDGFMTILEACRHYKIKHLIYASSSAVYGANAKIPFSAGDHVNHPVSLYAATKKANELMAHTYSHLFGIPATGLRFFTVYGPWGRPDMAYYSFTKKIIEGKPIQVFNHGNLSRDFTYIDDIVEGIVRLIDKPPKFNDSWDWSAADPSSSYAPYKVYNIGNNRPVKLMNFIGALEAIIGKKANIEFLLMQPGDVKETFADITDLEADIGFSPSTTIETGLTEFVKWYKDYH